MTGEATLLQTLATNVRVRRKTLALSQEALAHEVGVDVRYLGGIERAQENPTLKVIANLGAALDVHPAALLTPGCMGLHRTPLRTKGKPIGE